MVFRIERAATRCSPAMEELQLVEIVTPRTNSATFTALEHFFAAVARTDGISLELAGDGQARRFYARLQDQSRRDRLAAALGATYPQARLHAVTVDPVRLQGDEQVVCCRLELQEPEYLPLRVPRDAEVAADRAPQTDPLLGILAAIGGLPRG